MSLAPQSDAYEPSLVLRDSTPALLQAAVAANHRAFFVLQTRAAGGEVHQTDSVTWTDPGPDGQPLILFPHLAAEQAGGQLDRIVQFYRDRQPRSMVGCWSLDPSSPSDLDIRLLARGFQPGWRPCWMWLDVQRLQTHHPEPEELRIELLEAVPVWEAPELPYYDRATAAMDAALGAQQPRQIWHFVAWLADHVVGHSRLFVTTGPLGVAGIYDVGVIPQARNRGVGKAVTIAACQQAQALGYQHVLLNATGERMYRQLGFEQIGYGWTWWLDVARFDRYPSSSTQAALAEAVGRGDLDTLTRLAAHTDASTLDKPLANEMSLLELAAHAQQPEAAEWLVQQGVTLDPIVAWDLGWTERVVQMFAERPELANRRRGQMQTTPLHEAVERDDQQLVRVVLSARPNIALKDAQFGGTPLDWARHLWRTALIDLLQHYQASQAGT